MPLPTINDVQAVEPILQNMLLAYIQKEDRFVAEKVFPVVSVDKDSGTYYVFDKKYWFTDEMKRRAPGGPFPLTGFGVSTATFKTEQFALAQPIADETRKNSQIPMDLETAAVKFLGQKNLLRKEIQFAADFMVTGVWDTSDSSSTDWDDFSAGDPVNNIMTAKRTISNSTGMDANTMVVGYIVHQALINHPDIIDRIAYVEKATQNNLEVALAAILGVDRYLVAKGVYSNTNEATAFAATAIIDDDALLCYSNPAPSLFEASAGYTFTWLGGGGGGSMFNIRDAKAHADEIQILSQWDQKAVASDCGYIFLDIV